MNNRVKEIRTDHNLTMEKFGERIGIKRSAVSLIESGRNNVSDIVCTSICREFRVNEEWLRFGNGDKYIQLNNYEQIAKLTKDLLKDEPTSFKNRFINMLSQLSTEQWLLLEDMVKKLL